MDVSALSPFYVALLAIIVAGVVAAQFRILRRLMSIAFWCATLALGALLISEQGRFHPALAGIFERLKLDDQQVAGDEVRIRMAADGHFWVRARIGGIERRMLVDSGATVTALSQATADRAGAAITHGVTPVILQTAAGTTMARTATLDRLTIGGIEARDLKVVVSPAFGPLDVLGMNFLSQLQSWRVEGRTLILTPRRAA